MQVKALQISVGNIPVGTLFQCGVFGDPQLTIRFVAQDDFVRMKNAPTISLSMLANSEGEQRSLWANVNDSLFNGYFSSRNGMLLPPFFQGLLPEGVFRDHVAALRGCDPRDHFEMLAACGLDLPGSVSARPLPLTSESVAHLLWRDADFAELTMSADPMEEGLSLSGVQPKVGAIKEGDRYVGRTKLHHGEVSKDTHVIAKLPVVGYAYLPELEHLSLELAKAVEVNTCQAELVPLSKLVADHGYDLGSTNPQACFLAIERFDRSQKGRVHVEDFAQMMGVAPEDKYSMSYLDVARVMMSCPAMSEPAVHELLRRIAVNELLGNPDMHLKNMGVIYHDGITPTLSLAYDIVAYSAYAPREGHALHIMPFANKDKSRMRAESVDKMRRTKPHLSPVILRDFCAALGIPEKPAAAVVARVVQRAVKFWPEMVAAAPLTDRQKVLLMTHFENTSMVKSLKNRQEFGGLNFSAPR